MNLAVETLNRMLKHAPAAALMTTRETSVALQELGVGDIIEKNYRQPIYRNFSNYRQIIDIEFGEFGNYRKIIDIENCIQFYPINTERERVHLYLKNNKEG